MSASEPPLELGRLPRLKETIDRHGLSPDKRLGQHFLLDPAILKAIVRRAGELRDVPVLEVGPGPGGLTRALLEAGAQVTAIERDPRAIKALAELVAAAHGRLRLVEADALAIDTDALMESRAYAILANLPYNIGTELLLRWLLRPGHISAMHLMFQREVADRLTADTGDAAYGRLSVLAQSLCRVERVLDLPPGAFLPPPKVRSSIVTLVPHAERPAPEILAALQRATAAAFQQRRKMLRTSLRGLGMPLDLLLGPLGIDSALRAEALSVADYGRLAARLVALEALPPGSRRN